MSFFTYLLMGFLIVCAVSVSFSKNLLNSILIYMSFSLVMSVIWVILESPDLAITEAAVGAGITSILFFVTLKKIHAIDSRAEEKEEENEQKKNGVAVLCVGEDLDVLLELCDRILVLCGGKVTGIVDARTTSKEEIGLLMTKEEEEHA